MGFESNTGLGIKTHYGARSVGGGAGQSTNPGVTDQEVLVNFDADAAHEEMYLFAGSVVTGYDETFSTGAVTSILIGGVDTALTFPFTVSADGAVEVNGPTAGTVILKYDRVAG